MGHRTHTALHALGVGLLIVIATGHALPARAAEGPHWAPAALCDNPAAPPQLMFSTHDIGSAWQRVRARLLPRPDLPTAAPATRAAEPAGMRFGLRVRRDEVMLSLVSRW